MLTVELRVYDKEGARKNDGDSETSSQTIVQGLK